MSVDFRLAPTTEAGQVFVSRCEKHASDFVDRAAEHDREASFPKENIAALGGDSVMSAPLPEEFGGLGVESVTDLAIGVSRLANGDPATALTVTMHLGPCWAASRSWRQAVLREDRDAVNAFSLLLEAVGHHGCILCGAGTEPGTHTRFPQSEIRRVDDGWLLNGQKIFVTMSPMATLFNVFCRTKGPDGSWLAARAWVHRDADGLELVENWDGLGMRATGSHTVRFHDVVLPELMVGVRGVWGEWTAGEIVHSIGGNLAQIATYIGIAEHARNLVRETLVHRRKAPSGRLLAERHAVQTGFAEIETHISVARAILERTGRTWDAFLSRTDDDIEFDEAHQAMAEYQIAKSIVEKHAIGAVDVAMTLSGGSGYYNSNPLSRLYRDVRAGPFMQPFSPMELAEYVGKVRLGLEPTVDL